MTSMLQDSLLQEAQRDLRAAKVLVKASLYSATLYHLEQAFEKSIKSLYAYYSIIHDQKSETDVYNVLKGFSHDNSKTIPEIYSKMCDIEESFIHKIEKARPDLAVNTRFPQLKLQSLGMLSQLRESVHRFKNKIKNRTLADEKNLLNNYPTEIDKAYQNFKNLPSFIQRLVHEIGENQNLTGTENVPKPHPFLIFLAVSSDLIYCMVTKNDIYRYPFLEFENQNLQILNRPGMEKACNQLIEIMEFFLANIPSLMKPGGLAL